MPKLPKQKRDLNQARVRRSEEPVWKGPEVDGITQSLLGYYLVCKERFRVYTIDGLMKFPEFNASIEFGNMWHVCEEAIASKTGSWTKDLINYSAKLAEENRQDQLQVLKWYNVCKIHFPIYQRYWSEHEDEEKREPLLQEHSFVVPYELPSGRSVTLRGKWDAVDLIEGEGIFLQENKTKSVIDVKSIERQLTNDLQVMLYLVALKEYQYHDEEIPIDHPIMGVRYNVIRRPLAGGKGSIRPRKGTSKTPSESMDEFYDRLAETINEDVDSYFKRWKVHVTSEELRSFETQTLIPVLENLCDDYEWWSSCKATGNEVYDTELRSAKFENHTPAHYRLPYGVYNVIHQGGFDEIDDYLNTGSTVGLCKVPTFFPELDDADSSETN